MCITHNNNNNMLKYCENRIQHINSVIPFAFTQFHCLSCCNISKAVGILLRIGWEVQIQAPMVEMCIMHNNIHVEILRENISNIAKSCNNATISMQYVSCVWKRSFFSGFRSTAFLTLFERPYDVRKQVGTSELMPMGHLSTWGELPRSRRLYSLRHKQCHFWLVC